MSRSRSRSRERSASRDRSRSRTRSRSRESTPEYGSGQRRQDSRRQRSASGSPSPPPRSRRSPDSRREGSASPQGFRGRRSPTPESFGGFGSDYSGFGAMKKLDSSNKGHQMMQKMGWKGSGLGSGESGIVDPIEVSLKLIQKLSVPPFLNPLILILSSFTS